MKAAFLYATVVLLLVACDPEQKSSDEAAASLAVDPRTNLLVGTWRLGDEREYTFAADGKFSMADDTSKCGGEAPTKSTVEGTWQLEGDLLVLEVTKASDEMFRNSIMRDSIIKLESSTLVLKTSVIGCSGQEIELRKK